MANGDSELTEIGFSCIDSQQRATYNIRQCFLLDIGLFLFDDEKYLEWTLLYSNLLILPSEDSVIYKYIMLLIFIFAFCSYIATMVFSFLRKVMMQQRMSALVTLNIRPQGILLHFLDTPLNRFFI